VGSHRHRRICRQYVAASSCSRLRTQLSYLSTEAFCATGWRIGWLIGPPSIIRPSLAATTRIVFCTNSPLQEAVSAGLEQAEQRGYFATQRAEYAERRKILTDAFDKLGLTYTLPEGSYFILLVRNSVPFRVRDLISGLQDIKNVKFPEDYPFPPSILGRARDFKSVTHFFRLLI
jgi:kynurenine aminotransferase